MRTVNGRLVVLRACLRDGLAGRRYRKVVGL
jgi:hypothetical protein